LLDLSLQRCYRFLVMVVVLDFVVVDECLETIYFLSQIALTHTDQVFLGEHRNALWLHRDVR